MGGKLSHRVPVDRALGLSKTPVSVVSMASRYLYFLSGLPVLSPHTATLTLS